MPAENAPAGLADFRHVTVVGVLVAEQATRAWWIERCKAMIVYRRKLKSNACRSYSVDVSLSTHSKHTAGKDAAASSKSS